MEKLSKEEIIEKNKNLIGLLKKTKSSRDELLEEKKDTSETILHLKQELDGLNQKCAAYEEIVTDLSESKISYVTKNESLQRQLDLSTNEVESMKNSEKILISECKRLQEEEEKWGKIIAKEKHVIDQLRQNMESADANWAKKQKSMQATIEELELKVLDQKQAEDELQKVITGYGTVESECQQSKSELAVVQQQLIQLTTEKKASDIVYEALRIEKAKVDLVLKEVSNERDSLKTMEETPNKNEVTTKEDNVDIISKPTEQIIESDVQNQISESNTPDPLSYKNLETCLRMIAKIFNLPNESPMDLNTLVEVISAHLSSDKIHDMSWSNKLVDIVKYLFKYIEETQHSFTVETDILDELEVGANLTEVFTIVSEIFMAVCDHFNLEQQEFPTCDQNYLEKCNSLGKGLKNIINDRLKLQQEVVLFEKQSSELERNQSELTQKFESLTGRYTALEDQTAKAELHWKQEIEKVQTSNESLLRECNEKNQELVALEKLHEQLEKSQNDLCTLRTELKDKSDLIVFLEREMQLLQTEKQDQQDSLNKQIEKCQSFEENLSSLRQQLHEHAVLAENKDSVMQTSIDVTTKLTDINSSLETELIELKKNSDVIHTENCSKQASIEDLNKQLTDLRTEMTTQQEKYDSVCLKEQEVLKRLQEEQLALQTSQQQCADLSTNCFDMTQELESLRTSLQDSQSKLNILTELCDKENQMSKNLIESETESKASLKHLESELDQALKESKDAINQVDYYENLAMKFETNLSASEARAQLLETEASKQESKLQKSEDQILELQKKVEEYDTMEKGMLDQLTSKTIEIEDIENDRTSLKQHCEQLLQDINEMNQVLKERGNRILRLEDNLKIQNQQMETTKTELSTLQMKITCVENEATQKVTEPKQDVTSSPQYLALILKNQEMQQEVNRLEGSLCRNEQLNRSTYDAHSEVMSTSTIGRAEDGERMKELEDTFEERYMKLKSIALRLKRQLAETKHELKASEEAKHKLIRQHEDKKMDTNQMKNIQALQGEVDRCQDKLESKTAELKKLEKQLLTTAEEFAQFKSKFVALQDEKDSISSILKDVQQRYSELENVVQKQDKEMQVFARSAKSTETNLDALKKQMTEKDAIIATDNTEKDHTTKQLEAMKQASKKYTLIELEIRDYEKRFATVNEEVARKQTTIKSLTEQLQLEKQNSAEALKKSSVDLKEQLNQAQTREDKLRVQKEAAVEALENLKLELEQQKLSMAYISNNSSQVENALLSEKQSAERKVDELTEKLYKNEKSMEDLRQQLSSAEKDFDGYKLRARNVLKTKPKISEETHGQLQQEKENLEAQLRSVDTTFQQLKCELSATKAELGFLYSEKERLGLELRQATSKHDKISHDLNSELQKLNKTHAENILKHQQDVQNMTAQTESLDKNFKAQLASKEEMYEKELSQLQNQLYETMEKAVQIKSTENLSVQPTKLDADMADTIREQGEGSEWSEPHGGHYRPPSLDHLLSSPFPPPMQLDDSVSVISSHTDLTSKDLIKLEEQNDILEKRISHISVLLTESESENAKLSQLCETLKEELRKIARSETREKHLENNEYLKNIVLKFLHLKTGDEKTRLVPVLRTILQLSPQECNDLAKAASGFDSANSSQGWGNYLHLWSG